MSRDSATMKVCAHSAWFMECEESLQHLVRTFHMRIVTAVLDAYHIGIGTNSVKRSAAARANLELGYSEKTGLWQANVGCGFILPFDFLNPSDYVEFVLHEWYLLILA